MNSTHLFFTGKRYSWLDMTWRLKCFAFWRGSRCLALIAAQVSFFVFLPLELYVCFTSVHVSLYTSVENTDIVYHIHSRN